MISEQLKAGILLDNFNFRLLYLGVFLFYFLHQL
jgi:hypothetical protein